MKVSVHRGLKALSDGPVKITRRSKIYEADSWGPIPQGRYFDAVVCGDTCARRKPDPDQVLHACELLGVTVAEAVTIGDSINDAQAGRSAGTQVLVVPYGYNEGRDVRELDVDGIVDTLVNAAQWVELWHQNQNAAKAQA